VLAAGLLRDDLQAHLALAHVAEQPSATTPSSLLRWAISTSLARILMPAARELWKSSIPPARRRLHRVLALLAEPKNRY
jgi:hypothetical protein